MSKKRRTKQQREKARVARHERKKQRKAWAFKTHSELKAGGSGVAKDERKRKTPSKKGILRRARDAKREQAEARKRISARLSPMEQLASLDKKLGLGMGAKKERARLLSV